MFTNGGLVQNGSTGLIVADSIGISVTGAASSDDLSIVINAGSVEAGLYGIGVSGQGFALIQNSGTVTGLIAGIFSTTLDGSIRIVNSGTVEGNNVGLAALTLGTDQKVEIINSGTIKIGSLIPDIESGAIVAGGGSSVDLQNTGTIVGRVVIDGTSGSAVKNSGLIDGETLLGEGDDTFDGSKGTQGAVHGGGGNDVLIGGVGADSLYGELGNDKLTGGDGADEFWFTTTPNSKTNRDTITDFSAADGDKIVLAKDIYAGIGNGSKLKAKYFETGKPENKNDKIIYKEKKGLLIYAEKGSKTDKADWVKFAQVDKRTELDHHDFILV